MNEGMNLLIGPGDVGKAYVDLMSRDPDAEVRNLTPTHFMGSDRLVYTHPNREGYPLLTWGEIAEGYADVASFVIAMGSFAGGEIETEYATTLLNLGGVVGATAAKGALSDAEGYASLNDFIERGQFGIGASVGGNTPVLEIVRSHRFDGLAGTLDYVINNPNGTWAFVLGAIADGMDYEQAVRQADKEGYAEPGDGSAIEKMHGEIQDGDFKAAIINNTGRYTEKPLSYTDFEPKEPITDEEVLHVLENGIDYQMLTIVGDGEKILDMPWDESEDNLIGGTKIELDDEQMMIKGFVKVRAVLPEELHGFASLDQGPTSRVTAVRTIGNTVIPHTFESHGAGLAATATALRRDMLEISSSKAA